MPVTELFYEETETKNIAYGENGLTTTYSNWIDPEDAVVVVQANPEVVVFDATTMKLLGGHSIVKEMLENCPALVAMIADLRSQLDMNPGNSMIEMELRSLIEMYEANCLSDPHDDDDDDDDGDPVIGFEKSLNCPDADRNDRRGRERLTSIKFKSDGSILRQFCSWTRRNCELRVDLTFSAASSLTDAVYSAMPPRFIFQRRTYYKNNTPFTPNSGILYRYRYLESIHGDQYRLDFTGKHPREGDEVTWTVSLGVTAGFEIDVPGLGQTELELALGGSRSLKRTIRDYELGGEIIEFCDDALPLGKWYTYMTHLDFRLMAED